MYTWGHNEILEKALEKLDYTLTKNQLKELKIGLRYPDFPCGSYVFHQGRIIFKRTLCSLFRTFRDLTNNFASSYASHNGYYSVWHSMTYNPERSVRKITRDIIDQIISFLSLCFLDENTGHLRTNPEYFWLGMALHVVMDSYSPAHTLRCQNNCKKSIALVKANPTQLTSKMRKANLVLRELKDRLMHISHSIDNDDEHEINKILQDIFKTHNIHHKHQAEISKVALFIFFHNHHQISIKKQITDKDISNYTRKYKSNLQPIVTYYSYPQQPMWFHKLNDSTYMLHKLNLYQSAIDDCIEILNLTRELDRKIKVKRYLMKVYIYLFHKTFKLAHNVADNNTGVSQGFYKV